MFNRGFYIVNGQHYTSKTIACLEASKQKAAIKWYYYDEVWEKFSREKLQTLGKINLDVIYKQRAEQLRDKYDYLILNYSGGADSHNVLMSFINNNIDLDEVFVTWDAAGGNKIYIPNIKVKSAENLLSEWDYVLKPSLEWIAKYYPKIKITVKNPFDSDTNKVYSDQTFEDSGHYFGVFEMMRQNTINQSILEQSSKGKTVADIWGIDKPTILFMRNKAYLYFLDSTAYGIPRNVEKYGGVTECFYYTPDMPELVFEQGYKILQYFAQNDSQKEKLEITKMVLRDYDRIQWYNNIVKKIIYTTWDFNKFQVDKPVPYNYSSRSRDYYYDRSPYYISEKDKWRHHFHSFFKNLSPYLLSSERLGIRLFSTPKFYLGEI